MREPTRVAEVEGVALSADALSGPAGQGALARSRTTPAAPASPTRARPGGWDRLLILVGALAVPPEVALAITVAFAAGRGYAALWSVPFTVAFAGGVLAVRLRPDNRGARRLLVFGATSSAWNAAGFLLLFAMAHRAAAGWLLALDLPLVVLDLVMPITLLRLLALYPDRVGDRAAERALFRGLGALVVAFPPLLLAAGASIESAVAAGWAPDYTHGDLHVDNPLHIAVTGFLDAPLQAVHQGALGILPALALVMMLMRWWRGDADERRRTQWPLAGVLVVLALNGADGIAAAGLLPTAVTETVKILLLASVPALVTIGIVRPDLFDLPRVLRRTILYGVVWVAIAAAYLGIAAALGVAAGARQAAVLVTIAATLAFQPAWRRLRHGVRQRVYGPRATPDELLRRFGETLGHTLDLSQLSPLLAKTLRDGMALHWVRLSLDERVDVAGEATSESVMRVDLVHGRERLGSIECGGPIHGRFTSSDRELFETLARQAALALHNARLASRLGDHLAEIRRQAHELAASRTRIVAAEEAGRRRIERDIHDGIQQELVALIARIGLARNQLARDPTLATTTLADLQVEARHALDDLRELAGGIHPSVLSDHGIVGAIEARAARLGIGLTIECDRALRATRFSENVEGAAYFIVSEACTNSLKHSGVDRVTVCLEQIDGELHVTVSDDGGGFDVATTPMRGLNGLRDRVEAVGGRFGLRSEPGSGTSVTASLPVATRANG